MSRIRQAFFTHEFEDDYLSILRLFMTSTLEKDALQSLA
jgi:hypothetical protein